LSGTQHSHDGWTFGNRVILAAGKLPIESNSGSV
jgi:hypothetical protein